METKPLDPVKRAFLGSFDASAISKVVIVGGLPRSGTTSLDATLHARSDTFMCDEFHELRRLETRRFFNRLQHYHAGESRHWQDSEGRTWRGMGPDDYRLAAAHSLTQTLLSFSDPKKFRGKHSAEVDVFGFKHPRIEVGAMMFHNMFSPVQVHLVYVAREPVSVLRSIWEMSWTAETDPAVFEESIQRDYAQSLQHLQSLEGRGVHCHVFRTGLDTIDDLLGCLELDRQVESGEIFSDTWPSERRRSVEPIPDDIVERFSHSETVVAFRQAMALSATE